MQHTQNTFVFFKVAVEICRKGHLVIRYAGQPLNVNQLVPMPCSHYVFDLLYQSTQYIVIAPYFSLCFQTKVQMTFNKPLNHEQYRVGLIK